MSKKVIWITGGSSGIGYATAKKFINELGNPFKNILIDSSGIISIEIGAYGIPETFLVNSKGIIKYRHVGPISKKVFKKINLLIKEIE